MNKKFGYYELSEIVEEGLMNPHEKSQPSMVKEKGVWWLEKLPKELLEKTFREGCECIFF